MTKARDIASAIPAPSTVSSAELGFLDGVTSAIQTQLDGKQAINANVSTTELGYLDGVTSAIQTQIDSKIGSASAINPTIVDAKGDIIAATAADTVARLAVGANGTVLTAASGQATGLEWATPSSGGMTLLSTTNLSGSASVTVSSINSTYRHLYIDVSGATWGTGSQQVTFAVNNMGSDVSQAAITSLGTAAQASTGGTNISLSPGANVHQSNGFRSAIHVFDYANSDANRVGTFTAWAHSSAYRVFNGGYAWYSGTAVSSITIAASNNYAFSAGTVKVWGVK